MATLARAPIVGYKLTGGLWSMPVEHGLEDASETFITGAVLVMNTGTGEVAEGGADPASIVGVAMGPASGVQGRDVTYMRAEKGMRFAMSADKSGTLGTGTLAQTDMNKAYAIAKDSGGIWYVDLDDTTNVRVRIVEFISPIGDVMPRCAVEFLEVATTSGAI